MPSGIIRSLKLLPWLVVAGLPLVLPGYEPLATQIFVMILFALSLDLLVGYAGIVTLGHAGLFGMGGYTAGILSVHGITDPIITVLCAMMVAAITGLVFGIAMLRTKGLTLLMLTMASAALLYEIANKATGLTGGEDGLQGVSFSPLLGVFAFDFRGKTAFFYSLAVLFLVFTFVQVLINSPFGWSLRGIRENDARMAAIGCPIMRRRVIAYVIASALAGLAGALQAQTTQFVALHSLGFELSGSILIMLILGGVGPPIWCVCRLPRLHVGAGSTCQAGSGELVSGPWRHFDRLRDASAAAFSVSRYAPLMPSKRGAGRGAGCDGHRDP